MENCRIAGTFMWSLGIGFPVLLVLLYSLYFLLDMITHYCIFSKILPRILTIYTMKERVFDFDICSVVEWMFKNSLECIRKFVESDYEIWVMCHIGDIVCWGCGMSGLSNVRDVECSGCGILGMWDIRNVRCSRCGMFGTWDVEMWDFGDIGCLGCRMFGMWNVRDVGCWDVRCSRRGMCGMWYVRDVGCWGCAMCDVCRDVRCWFT